MIELITSGSIERLAFSRIETLKIVGLAFGANEFRSLANMFSLSKCSRYDMEYVNQATSMPSKFFNRIASRVVSHPRNYEAVI